jgi:hypothetical protein
MITFSRLQHDNHSCRWGLDLDPNGSKVTYYHILANVDLTNPYNYTEIKTVGEYCPGNKK